MDTQEGIFECVARGLFRLQGITPMVGDSVEINSLDYSDYSGCIALVNDRKNQLLRPPAANIDQALLVFAASNPAPDLLLLDKLLILCEMQQVPAIILINKSDISPNLSKHLGEQYQNAYRVLGISAKDGLGLSELFKLTDGKTSLFLGPSGVGKSSLVNRLMPKNSQKTGDISKKLKRGRHTTRHIEIIPTEHGYVLDSPGFSKLSLTGLTGIELSQHYPEFRPYLGQCFFNNCMHISEPDCEIKAHIGKDIHPDRYARYEAITKELADEKIKY